MSLSPAGLSVLGSPASHCCARALTHLFPRGNGREPPRATPRRWAADRRGPEAPLGLHRGSQAAFIDTAPGPCPRGSGTWPGWGTPTVSRDGTLGCGCLPRGWQPPTCTAVMGSHQVSAEAPGGAWALPLTWQHPALPSGVGSEAATQTQSLNMSGAQCSAERHPARRDQEDLTTKERGWSPGASTQ